jgi:hypothetical protein
VDRFWGCVVDSKLFKSKLADEPGELPEQAEGWAAWEAAMLAKRGVSGKAGKASSARLRREMLEMARESMASGDVAGSVDGLGGADKAWVVSQLCQEFVREFDLPKIKDCESLGGKLPAKAFQDMAGGAGNPGKAGGEGWKACFAYAMERAGKELNALDGQMAPLHQALAGNGLCSQGAAIGLLEMGADPNLATRSGRLPLELAIGAAKDLACVELARREGRVADGRSALCMAVAAGLPKLAEHLLGAGADPEHVDPVHGSNALDLQPGGPPHARSALLELMAGASKKALGSFLAEGDKKGEKGSGRGRL